MNILLKRINYLSSAGELVLVSNDEALTHIIWKKGKQPIPESIKVENKVPKILQDSQQQLDEYFAGQRKTFDLPIEETGTAFQRSVWQALREIPYGKTISYKQLAININNPGAVRAVGSANGKNPISIITPCHRVIAANGSVGGYAGGLYSKEKLLDLEKNHQI